MAELLKENAPGADLAPALRFVAGLAVDAASAKGLVDIVPIPNDPRNRYLIVNDENGYEIEEPAPAPRKTELQSVSEVAAYVNFVKTGLVQPSVYYDADSVVIVHDDAQSSRRLDRATVAMEQTPQFALLAGLDKQATPYKQRDFIRLFNRDLRDCISPDDLRALLKALRALEWETGIKGTDTVERGRESMGREIKQELQSKAGPIPEEIMLNCNVYTDKVVSSYVMVHCLIEIDPRAQCFTLEPLAGQIDEAILSAVNSVGNVLRAEVKDSAPVFFGKP